VCDSLIEVSVQNPTFITLNIHNIVLRRFAQILLRQSHYYATRLRAIGVVGRTDPPRRDASSANTSPCCCCCCCGTTACTPRAVRRFCACRDLSASGAPRCPAPPPHRARGRLVSLAKPSETSTKLVGNAREQMRRGSPSRKSCGKLHPVSAIWSSA
jgi:hypothetical protein